MTIKSDLKTIAQHYKYDADEYKKDMKNTVFTK